MRQRTLTFDQASTALALAHREPESRRNASSAFFSLHSQPSLY